MGMSLLLLYLNLEQLRYANKDEVVDLLSSAESDMPVCHNKPNIEGDKPIISDKWFFCK